MISNKEPWEVCEHVTDIKNYNLGFGAELGSKACAWYAQAWVHDMHRPWVQPPEQQQQQQQQKVIVKASGFYLDPPSREHVTISGNIFIVTVGDGESGIYHL